MLEVFEKKVDELEESYKEKNKNNFDEDKMKKYINRKLKREIQILNYCNIMPSVRMLETSESFKY
ncbi:hypothetical protein J4443_00190 [Candidatus Woesearchaeota archaeon]|nr:hypothetical protein [Candidatus Woesearchaeota archaeon]